MRVMTVVMCLLVTMGAAEAAKKKGGKRKPASINAKSVVTMPLYNKSVKQIGTKFMYGGNVCYKYSNSMACMKK